MGSLRKRMSRRSRHSRGRFLAMFMVEAWSREELREMTDAVWEIHLKHCSECTDQNSPHVRVEADL